jgi:RNA polymerase sigma-70 factor (ECF subfamily)
MPPAAAPLRLVPPPDPPVDQPIGRPIGRDLDTVYRVYARYVAGIALRLIGRDDELEDVIQDVFLAAVGGLDRLEDPEALKGWLATVTVRVAMRRLRRRRLRSLLGLDRPCDYTHLVMPGVSPEEHAELVRAYQRLDTLPVRERVAWSLRYIEGEPLEVVAERCGCSLATVKRRIAAAAAVLSPVVDHG